MFENLMSAFAAYPDIAEDVLYVFDTTVKSLPTVTTFDEKVQLVSDSCLQDQLNG